MYICSSKTRGCSLINVFYMSILTIINKEARKYAECNAETDEERSRMEEDFRNGAISAYRDVFNLYLHGDLSFSLGR